MDTIKLFSRSLLLSGGGTRFALYNGMYAALCDIGKAPELLIASCGGAFCYLVINAFANNTERKSLSAITGVLPLYPKPVPLPPYSKLHRLGAF